MKLYEQIADLEKKIYRTKQSAAFLRGTLEAVDRAIQLKKQKLDEDIIAYNKRAIRDQEILDMHEKNIANWSKKLDKNLTKQLKSIDKEKVEVVVEKSEKDIRKEKLQAKKRLLAEELKKAKEQLDKMKEEKKEEIALAPEPIPERIDAEEIEELVEKVEEIIEPKPIEPPIEVSKEEQVNIIKEVKEIVNDKLEALEPGKVQCPECKGMFTKGGAFAAHYKSHFNGE